MFENSTSDSGVLRSEAYLTGATEPDQPVNRSSELEAIEAALQPLTRRKPASLLIYGPAGVGKTTTANYVLEEFRRRSRVKPVSINCWKYSTRPSLYSELLIQLGYPAPRKGKPVDELLSRIREWVDKNRSVILALDEFDQLDEKGAVVYNLYQLNQRTDNSIGFLLLSNSPPDQLDLDARTRSRLGCTELEFDPYSAQQLEAILRAQSEQAFHPGTVPNEVLSRIAAHIADQDGDCRRALEHLLEAGRLADRRSEREITEEILDDVLTR